MRNTRSTTSVTSLCGNPILLVHAQQGRIRTTFHRGRARLLPEQRSFTKGPAGLVLRHFFPSVGQFDLGIALPLLQDVEILPLLALVDNTTLVL